MKLHQLNTYYYLLIFIISFYECCDINNTYVNIKVIYLISKLKTLLDKLVELSTILYKRLYNRICFFLYFHKIKFFLKIFLRLN